MLRYEATIGRYYSIVSKYFDAWFVKIFRNFLREYTSFGNVLIVEERNHWRCVLESSTGQCTVGARSH